jgi:hypothetical protein
VIRSKILAKAAIGLCAVVAPMAIAIGGAASASADPGWCVSGPFGYASACLQAPGWAPWYGGPGWYGGGWRHGGGDDQGEDD